MSLLVIGFMMSMKNCNGCDEILGLREVMGIINGTGKEMGIKRGCAWERELE